MGHLQIVSLVLVLLGLWSAEAGQTVQVLPAICTPVHGCDVLLHSSGATC